MNTVFTVGNMEIPLYGIFFYCGVLAAAAAAYFLCSRVPMARFDLVGSAIYVMIGAIAGAKLLFLAVSFRTILALHLPLEAILKGGFVFYGGLLGGAAGLWIYTRQYRLPFPDFGDLYAVVLPLGHAFGRVGCFFAGCCYGIPYDGCFSYTYHASAGSVPLGVPLLPVQLMEAALLLLLFGLQLWLFCRFPRRRGMAALVYATVYPVLRFTLEFLRGDTERGSLWGLSLSQWISLGLFSVSVFCRILQIRKKSIQDK